MKPLGMTLLGIAAALYFVALFLFPELNAGSAEEIYARGTMDRLRFHLTWSCEVFAYTGALLWAAAEIRDAIAKRAE